MSELLLQNFILLLLIFIRILAAFSAAPLLGHNSFPALPRILLSFFIAYILMLSLKPTLPAVETTMGYLFVNGVKEVITGTIIGFMLQIVFHGISFAGSLIGFDLGFSMAELFNPADDSSNNILGQLLYMAALIIFILINGHHYLIRGLAASFVIVPPGTFKISKPLFQVLINGTGSVFIIAIKIASPVLVSFFLIHVAEGIIARVVPQMQVFFVTQPLKTGAGLLLLSVLIPVYVYVIKDMLKQYEDSLFTVIKSMGN